MGDRAALGRHGEQAAAAYLQEHGLRVVARNWRCRHGEIDIIATEGAVLVFCEVKTRRGTAFGGPLAAVTATKVARMRRLAALWLLESGGHRGPIRLDVIGMLSMPGGTFRVEHVRGVA